MSTITQDKLNELITSGAKQGINKDAIISGLKARGHSIEMMPSDITKGATDMFSTKQSSGVLESLSSSENNKPTIGERFRASFGDADTKSKMAQREQEAGLRGKFDVGDIADVAGDFLPLAGGILGSFAGPVVGTAVGATAGEVAKRGIGQALGVRDKSLGQEAIGTLETGAITGALGVAGKVASPLAKGTGKIISKLLPGVSESFRMPTLMKLLRTNKVGIAEIADATNKAVGQMAKESKGIYDIAQKSMKNIPIDRKTLVGNAKTFIKETSDRIMTDESERLVGKLTQQIKKLPENPTKQDVLKLRQVLDKSYKGTESTKDFDSILTGVKKKLNEVLDYQDIAYKTAREKASKDIELLKKIGIDITAKGGKSVESTSKKLLSIAQDLQDPIKRGETKKLLKQISDKTGLELEEILDVVNAAQRIERSTQQGIMSPFSTLGGYATQAASAVARGAGQVADKITPITNTVKQATKDVRPFLKTAGKTTLANILKPK